MRILLMSGAALSACFFAGNACAQFTNPPTTPPPVCDREKDFPLNDPVGSACRAGLILTAPVSNTNVFLDCTPHNGTLACNAYAEWFDGSQWQVFEPSLLFYSWDFIVDNQEYSLTPGHDASMWFDCGYTRHGYVRVTAEGSTAMIGFSCPAAREDLEMY
jgi:hypothetical protein